MARGNLKVKKRAAEIDPRHQSQILAKFINHIMLDGKKGVARKIVYDALDKAAAQLKSEPMEIFEQVLRNVAPILEVRSRRIGGANYQVPMEVGRERKNALAMKWVIDASRSGKGKPMADKLSFELVAAFNNEGAAIKKREETHRMAEANKAFAHFARF